MVSIPRLKTDPEYGANDYIEKGQSAELGKKYSDKITDRMAKLAKSMISWDSEKLEAFIAAERSIVSAQIKGWRLNHPWAAWSKIAQGEIVNYGILLENEQFKEIEELASQLL